MSKNALANSDPDPDFQNQTLPYPVNPERRLLAAFLMRAILDCCTDTFVSAEARRSAKRYIFGEGEMVKKRGKWVEINADHPLPFNYVCSELDLEPENVRVAIREMQAGERPLPMLCGKKH